MNKHEHIQAQPGLESSLIKCARWDLRAGTNHKFSHIHQAYFPIVLHNWTQLSVMSLEIHLNYQTRYFFKKSTLNPYSQNMIAARYSLIYLSAHISRVLITVLSTKLSQQNSCRTQQCQQIVGGFRRRW